MQGIVIQGPTNHYKKIIEHYKHIPNIVWSTWEDEPIDNLKYIENNIPLIVNKKPSFPGYLNVNLQVLSTFSGIKYLTNNNVTEILKIRGDIIVSDIDKLLYVLKGKQLSFLQMCKPGIRKDIYYELEYNHNSHDYPADVIIYGSSDNMLNGFNFYINEFQSIPPESLISYSLFNNMDIKFKLDHKYLTSNGVTFFMQDCLDNNINILWLKNNLDIVEGTKDKIYYEY
jgi:hypothetical protein